MRTHAILAVTTACLAAAGFAFHIGGTAARASSDAFTDVTERAGISWKHFSGESEDRYLVEAMGGGVAFADFDNDGQLDIFLVTGGKTPGIKTSVAPRNA